MCSNDLTAVLLTAAAAAAAAAAFVVVPAKERKLRSPIPHISNMIGASGFRIGEGTFAERAFPEAEELSDADRV